MGRYVIRRLLQAIPLLLIISVIGFTLYNLVPNSPFQSELALNPMATQEDIARLEAKFGLDRPVHERYLTWLGNAAGGLRALLLHPPAGDGDDPGAPPRHPAPDHLGLHHQPPGRRPPWHPVRHQAQLPLDNGVRATVIVTSFPSWWIGLIAIVFLGASSLVPPGSMYTIGRENDIFDRLHHLLLPMVAGIDGSVGYLRIMRSQTLETLRQDYVRTAYAKGLAQRMVMWGHVLRNAFLPVWTGFGASSPA